LAALAAEREADGDHIGGALQALPLALEVRRSATPGAQRDPAHLLVTCPQRHHERGLAVVFVSHNLPQVLEVADRIEVMRLGARVARFRGNEVGVERLIAAISGAYTNEVQE